MPSLLRLTGPNGGWRAVLGTEGLIFVIVVIVPIVAVGDVVAVAIGLKDEGVVGVAGRDGIVGLCQRFSFRIAIRLF